MFQRSKTWSALILAAVCVAGCTSSVSNKGDGSGNPEDLLVTTRVGPNDLKTIAQTIANDIKVAPNVHATPTAPAVIRVSPFLNETDDVRWPMDEMVDSVMNELTRTGKLEAVSTDPAAIEAMVLKMKANRQSGVLLEDYTLTGRVTRDEETKGDTRQFTYYVNFKVTDTNRGTVVLTSQTKCIKIQKRASLGF